MILYHATTFPAMNLILGREEADPDFDEVNGFTPTRIALSEKDFFAGRACFSDEPIDLYAGRSYYVAVVVPEGYDLEDCKYDDLYPCQCYAIPVADVNTWRMFQHALD